MWQAPVSKLEAWGNRVFISKGKAKSGAGMELSSNRFSNAIAAGAQVPAEHRLGMAPHLCNQLWEVEPADQKFTGIFRLLNNSQSILEYREIMTTPPTKNP